MSKSLSLSACQGKIRTLATWLLFALVAAFGVGCGNSDNYVYQGNSGQAGTNLSLQVSADPAALARGDILAQFGADTVNLRISLYGVGTVELDQQTVPRTGTAVFTVPGGLYVVRMVGLNANGDIMGYFDRLILLDNSEKLLIPGLRVTNMPPSPSIEGTQNASPFFIFSSTPATAVGATEFSVTAKAFQGTGAPFVGTIQNVGLSSASIGFDVNPAAKSTDATGVVTFDGLAFPSASQGTTILTVSATGVDSANSREIPVSKPAPFYTTLEQISVNNTGAGGNGGSYQASMSGDGNQVVFASEASNLVSNDTNMFPDIFVRDRAAGTTRRVSVDAQGGQSDNESFEPSISSDGKFVGFGSRATNLVSGDTEMRDDVFLYNLVNGAIKRLSAGGDDFTRAPSLSADANLVSFDGRASNLTSGDTNGVGDIFVYDSNLDSFKNLTGQGNGDSEYSNISADGRFVVFRSQADNLVSGDTNGVIDAFVCELATNTIERVSVSSQGVQADAYSFDRFGISQDGRYVVFASGATNLVANDTNGRTDIFVRDRLNQTTERVSISGSTQADGDSFEPSISGDGRFVAFGSLATNLVTGDTNQKADVFVVDRATGRVERVSLTNSGAQGDDGSYSSGLSRDGRFVLIGSEATNLVSGDTNAAGDIFVVANPFRR